jgi:carbamoyl-phosphate synthase small subunit
MKLLLDDGAVFEGRPFGASREVAGEVVFNTGMTGYVEALTDPSYRGQILVLTYPLQGNYGVPAGRFESPRIQVQGLVVQRLAVAPSHHATTRSLGEWLASEGVPAIEGVDTRTLTRRLRERGTMSGTLLHTDGAPTGRAALDVVDMAHVARLVAGTEIVRHTGGELRLLLVDTGVKASIVEALQARGATVIQAPFFAPWEGLLDEVDGVVLGNGPGDPASLQPLVERIRLVLAKRVPTFGVCLGHQLLALAAGAKTFKLPYGHRSQNQPVQEVATRRAFVTSQNHGYAVDDASLPADWEPWFVNLNDGTNEGIRHRVGPWRSVQFHPEGAPGPKDTAMLFDDFVRLATEMRRPRAHESSRIDRVAQAT